MQQSEKKTTMILSLSIILFLFQIVSADYNCKNWVVNCDVYAKKGWCAEIHPNHNYMKNMCPKICGFCGDDKTTNPPIASTATPTSSTTTTKTEPPKTTYQPPTLNPLNKCQLPDVAVSRIISGRDAKAGQFPWQVAMYVNGHFNCGGSILKPDWLITAAHCLEGLQPSHKITFVAGELDRSVSSGHEQTSEIEMPYMHPHYHAPISLNNDIALIKLKRPFIFNRFVQPVCVPEQHEEIAPGSKCILSGWGRTEKNGETPNSLKFTKLYVVNQTQCVGYNRRITNYMMCGYDKNNHRASGCQGDSGGPLMCQDSNGAWKLHGVVSWGTSSCETKYKYTTFTRMSKYRYFINDTLGLIEKPTLPPPSKGGCDADISGKDAFVFKSLYSSSTTNQMCGRSAPASGRVIAGKNVKAGQFPWQVAIYKTSWNWNQEKDAQIPTTMFQCGGSLIAPQWILTASHCVYRSYPRKFNVSIGVTNRKTGSAHEQQVGVDKLFTHPQYKKHISLNNDVALLKLSSPIRLNDYRATVCLPGQGQRVPVGSKCFISGWGKTSDKPFTVDQLQHAPLSILSNEVCYKRQWRLNEITDKMVCASAGRGCPQSGCQGDSGGPLVCQQTDGRWVQHGVVSYGSPYCDTKEASTVFARVSEFKGWIDDVIKQN